LPDDARVIGRGEPAEPVRGNIVAAFDARVRDSKLIRNMTLIARLNISSPDDDPVTDKGCAVSYVGDDCVPFVPFHRG
jgi:hypothetical protein